ncbi:MAG TPA: GNAT family N-acetyltransferase [Oligoflexia bacterium]|nr:GNAT family N-acetyltransferase [Oligoflexia bacterium]HMR24028.1 GNAT family N-acetyltransferase [Oligoflexia bacterium]
MMNSNDYKVLHEIPTAQDYCDLRIKCGLSAKDLESVKKALPRSIYAVQIMHQGKMIAMGRIVGDGGCFVQVTDIAVDPEYQKQGLSKIIMENIMAYIDQHIPKSCFVTLFADVDYLYQKYGFVVSAQSIGMKLQRS